MSRKRIRVTTVSFLTETVETRMVITERTLGMAWYWTCDVYRLSSVVALRSLFQKIKLATVGM